MLAHKNHRNIRRRVKILRYIFLIEDAIILNFKAQFQESKYSFIELENFIDASIDIKIFKKILEKYAKYNSSLSKTFTKNEFNIYDFLEKASFKNSLDLIWLFNEKIKLKVFPISKTIEFHKKNLSNVIKLRNMTSHYTIENVDDIIDSLKKPWGSDDSDHKTAYVNLISYYLQEYKLGKFKKVTFDV